MKYPNWNKVEGDYRYYQVRYNYETADMAVTLHDERDEDDLELDEDENWSVGIHGTDTTDHFRKEYSYDSDGERQMGNAYFYFRTKAEAQDYMMAMLEVINAVHQGKQRLEAQGRTNSASMTIHPEAEKKAEHHFGIQIGAEVSTTDESAFHVQSLLNFLMMNHKVEYYGQGIYDVYEGGEDVSEEEVESWSTESFKQQHDWDALQEEMESYQIDEDCPECGSSKTFNATGDNECAECGHTWE